MASTVGCFPSTGTNLGGMITLGWLGPEQHMPICQEITGWESQLAGPVGHVETQPRSWTSISVELRCPKKKTQLYYWTFYFARATGETIHTSWIDNSKDLTFCFSPHFGSCKISIQIVHVLKAILSSQETITQALNYKFKKNDKKIIQNKKVSLYTKHTRRYAFGSRLTPSWRKAVTFDWNIGYNNIYIAVNVWSAMLSSFVRLKTYYLRVLLTYLNLFSYVTVLKNVPLPSAPLHLRLHS